MDWMPRCAKSDMKSHSFKSRFCKVAFLVLKGRRVGQNQSDQAQDKSRTTQRLSFWCFLPCSAPGSLTLLRNSTSQSRVHRICVVNPHTDSTKSWSSYLLFLRVCCCCCLFVFLFCQRICKAFLENEDAPQYSTLINKFWTVVQQVSI